MMSIRLARTAHNKKLMAPIAEAARELRDSGAPVPVLRYKDFRLFAENGNRTVYEAPYNERRRRLCLYTAMCLWEPDEKSWDELLCDVLMAILDEWTWALPAHVDHKDPDPESYATTVDLFCAETAQALSEIDFLLGDRLPALIRTRIRREVKRRVVTPFLIGKRNYGRYNWAAVCVGSAAQAMMNLGMDAELREAMPLIDDGIRRFIGGFPEDGCCLEGPLYWEYGFGYFCFFAARLYDYTGGKIDYFADERVHRTALFRQKTCLGGTLVTPFADAPAEKTFGIGLLHFLAKRYPDVTLPDPDAEPLFGEDERYRFAPFIRNFLWYDEKLAASTERRDVPAALTVFPAAGWFRFAREKFFLAAKGGHNDEPHNHNDVGSFVLTDRDEHRFVIRDPGWEEYTGETFGPRRYTHLCMSSRGHALPVIGGAEQKAGHDARAELLGYTDDSLSFRVDACGGEVFERTFRINKEGIAFTDTLCGDAGSFTERLPSDYRPEVIDAHTVRLGRWILSCPDAEKVNVSGEHFESRFASFCHDPETTVYYTEFSVRGKKADVSVSRID